MGLDLPPGEPQLGCMHKTHLDPSFRLCVGTTRAEIQWHAKVCEPLAESVKM